MELEFGQEYQGIHPACEGNIMENEQNDSFLVDMFIFHKVDMFIFQKAISTPGKSGNHGKHQGVETSKRPTDADAKQKSQRIVLLWNFRDFAV